MVLTTDEPEYKTKWQTLIQRHLQDDNDSDTCTVSSSGTGDDSNEQESAKNGEVASTTFSLLIVIV